MTMRDNNIFSESDDDECDLEMPELEMQVIMRLYKVHHMVNCLLQCKS